MEFIFKNDYYKALPEFISKDPADIIEAVGSRKIVGRGGAAFPAAMKWTFVAQTKSDIKYIICNADEGEPGTFKDRAILERCPQRVLEGMTIAARAIGACKGFILLRGEYAVLESELRKAIEDAKVSNLLGKNILGSGMDFDITVSLSAGGYVCGEETAAINTIEGKRGEPRLRPPYPALKGLNDKPTLINNVETFAQVSAALAVTVEEYLSYGDEISGGTKLISLAGMVEKPGIYEIPLGKYSVKELIESEEFGGGIRNSGKFAFCQFGGQSGKICFKEQLYTPYGYKTLADANLSVGSGSIAVYDETVCPLEYIYKTLEFFAGESCGKCAPCRYGLAKAADMMKKVCEGSGDILAVERLLANIKTGAACGLGQAAGTAFNSFMKYRRDELMAASRK